MAPPDTYHHGALRRALLDRAVELIGERGPDAITIRGIASDLGVTHTAVAHHVRSRTGLFTAVAAEGFEQFSDTLSGASEDDDLLELGVAYVRFALEHPAYVRVMFRPDILDLSDPDLAAARAAAMGHLTGAVHRYEDPVAREHARELTLAAWSLVHGFAELTLNGSLHAAGLLGATDQETTLDLARRAASRLDPGTPRPSGGEAGT